MRYILFVFKDQFGYFFNFLGYVSPNLRVVDWNSIPNSPL